MPDQGDPGVAVLRVEAVDLDEEILDDIDRVGE